MVLAFVDKTNISVHEATLQNIDTSTANILGVGRQHMRNDNNNKKHPYRLAALEMPRQTEVGQSQMSVSKHENVLQLQVSVEDVVLQQRQFRHATIVRQF